VVEGKSTNLQKNLSRDPGKKLFQTIGKGRCAWKRVLKTHTKEKKGLKQPEGGDREKETSTATALRVKEQKTGV